MSRAREGTHAWVVADNLEQATEDLRWDWSQVRTPTWAIDTGLPAPAEVTREAVAALPAPDQARLAALALARTKAGGDAVSGLKPQRCGEELAEARAALHQAEQDLSDLRAGSGDHVGTEAGRAVSDLARSQAALTATRWAAEHSPRRRERKDAAKESVAVAGQLADAERRWQAYVAPEAARLQVVIHERQEAVDGLAAQHERQVGRSRRLAELGKALEGAAHQFAFGLDGYRARLDSGGSRAPSNGTAASYRVPQVAATYHQPLVEHDLGPDM